jgi:intracellular sulfur oxidation DsrE/DsrF family protein
MKISAFLFAFLLALSLGQAATAQSQPPHRIVMQLVSGDTLAHKSLFVQLRNLTEGWGDSVAIEVVCHGPGMNLLMTAKSTQGANIAKFQQQGVRFVACENTLKERKIDKSELLPQLDFVKMGIAEIVIKQEQGWSYIKAGF